MSIGRIAKPLPGERVVALSPGDAGEAAATWLRRPNLFPGRALTAPTLDARSAWAAGRIAQRGQAFTAGVVRGLETGYVVGDPPGEGERPAVRLYLGAGRGLAASGEDVVVARDQEVDFWALQVVAPPGVFEGGGFGGGGVLQPRAVGPTLGELLDELPDALPRAGVLLLQPALVDKADVDPEDPCDRCACDDGVVGFEDWRYADAVRLLWYAWPEDWRPLPATGAAFRNRLAWTVFDGERALGDDEVMPWELVGVPVALVGVDGDFLPTFADRAAVVRRGGRGRHSRLHLVTAPGGLGASPRLPGLWQARIEQLAEQVAEMGEPVPEPGELAASFGRLPPFGLLPRNVLDLDTLESGFFPETFDLDAVPVPVEQLDLAVRESAGLAPVDMAVGERVRILVPVSQASYEPRLLMTEEIDPEFQETLSRFLTNRTRALAGRQSVRVKSSVLVEALEGEAPPVPDPSEDPRAVEPESLEGWVPEAAGGHLVPLGAGVHGHGFEDATATLATGEGRSFYAWAYLDPDLPPRTLMLEWRRGQAERRAYWGENLIELGTDGNVTRMPMGDLPPLGRWVRLEVPAALLDYESSEIHGMVFRLYDGRAAFGPAGVVDEEGEVPWFDGTLPEGADTERDGAPTFLTANELLAPFDDRHGVVPAEDDAADPDGVSEALAELADDARLTGALSGAEMSQLEARGVEGFIAYLGSRADRADDLVNYGFLKVQTDVYRVRQLVLGNTDATRLAVSPALAQIAKAETAVASQENISTLFDRLRQSGGEGGPAGAEGASPAGGPVAGPSGASAASGPSASMMAAPQPVSAFSGATRAGTAGGTVSGETLFAGASAPLLRGGLVEGGLSGGVVFGGGVLQPSGGVFERPVGEITSPRVAPSTVEVLRAQTFGTPIVATTATYTPKDITNATPLVGNFEIRTLSLAERLQPPRAQEARDYSTSSRHEAVLGLVRLADELRAQDGEMPGLFEGIDVYGVSGDPFLEADTGGEEDEDPVVSLRLPLARFITGPSRATLLPALLAPPRRDTVDEAQYFSDTADLADRTVALLRQVEGRVKRYREAIAACEATRAVVQGQLRALFVRERGWTEVLEEARHDVAVTRAIMAEELERLAAINRRRAEILEREVRFLAYVRPRAADNIAAAASRPLDPGLLDAPVPTCLRESGAVPDELREMLTVVREAPAEWYRLRTPLLDGLDRVDLLLKVVRTAQIRAARAQEGPALQIAAPASGLAAAIGKVQVLQRQRVSLPRSRSLQLDVARLAQLSWKGVRAEAARVVSLGDLIDGEHGQASVARNAAAFFERFGRVAGCLHAGFSEVLPSIRLDWAEILSEFDQAPNLRNLSSLPRWPEIGYEERRRLQGLVDWLFDQLDPKEPEARGLVDDVVRMCVLLASHAPVGRIVAGRLPRPVTARPGVRIPLLPLDAGRLRVGMHALVYRANAIVARAVVEDVGTAEASARVTYTAQASVELDQDVRVQFAQASAISIASSAAFGAR